MPKSLISDDRQLDTKARDYCGSERHERLFFSMSPTGSGTPESVAQVVERLVLKQQGRAPGSFAMSAQKGYMVKVEALWGDNTFAWEVRKDGKAVDVGVAIIRGNAIQQIPFEVDPTLFVGFGPEEFWARGT